MSKKKYQVFISSTYEDLKDERQIALKAVLKSECIPAGMELFVPEDKSQWEIIKNWIDESDYYLLIVGGRYGSIEPTTGKSYTQLEYEYAKGQNIPILAFLEKNYKQLDTYTAEQNKDKLEAFIHEVFYTGTRQSSIYEDISRLSEDIILALNKAKVNYKRNGWCRDILNKDIQLLELDNNQLKAINNNLLKSIEQLKTNNRILQEANNDLNKRINNDNILASKEDFLNKDFTIQFTCKNKLGINKKYTYTGKWKDLFYYAFLNINTSYVSEYNIIQNIETYINKASINITKTCRNEFFQILVSNNLIVYDVFKQFNSTLFSENNLKLTDLGISLLNRLAREK